MHFFRRHFLLLILLLLIAGSIWMTISTEKKLHRINPQKNTIDAYFKTARYKQFNNEGQLILDIKTPYATLNEKDKYLDADSPTVRAYNRDGSHWLITANHATTRTDSHMTVLRGNVVIFKQASSKDPSVTLKTDHLTLYPRDKAITDAPVTLLQGDGWRISGVGCEIDLKTDTVKVLSQTDALIVPQRTTKKSDR